MDVNSLRPDISQWRLKAGVSQEELDQRAGFSKGTAGRIERGERNVTEKEIVRILMSLDLDVSSAFIAACGGLLRRLLKAEAGIREQTGTKPSDSSAEEQEQTQFKDDIDQMIVAFRKILLRFGAVSHPVLWAKDLMLTAAPEEEPAGGSRKRVRKKG